VNPLEIDGQPGHEAQLIVDCKERGVGTWDSVGDPQTKFPMAIGRLREKTESEGKELEEE
jgi:hypothetical protein